MNFSELSIGQKASRTKVVSDADVRDFARISGDMNPIHLDADYAALSIFKQRVAHGILISGLISAVIGDELPGRGAIYMGQDSRFVAPVFIGDEIRAEVTVLELREDKKIVKLSTNCFKADGTQVLSGTAVVKLSA